MNSFIHVQFAQNIRLGDSSHSMEVKNDKIVLQEWPIFEPLMGE